MSADALQAKLADLGTPAVVEARGRVAVVTPHGKVDLDAQTRRRVVSAARQHGFSNVCVELTGGDANLSGD